MLLIIYHPPKNNFRKEIFQWEIIKFGEEKEEEKIY